MLLTTRLQGLWYVGFHTQLGFMNACFCIVWEQHDQVWTIDAVTQQQLADHRVLSVCPQGVDLNQHSSVPGEFRIAQRRGEVDKNPIC